MSIITAKITNKTYYKNAFFGFLVSPGEEATEITMEMFDRVLSTKEIPQTSYILKKHLPSVFYSTCFNEYNFSFRKEVKNTEIGHLFEHILLEFLCDLKRGLGIKNPVYNGLTRWNWFEDKKGVFHISVDSGIEDEEILNVAMRKSIKLLSEILQAIPIGIVRKRRPHKVPIRPALYIDLK